MFSYVKVIIITDSITFEGITIVLLKNTIHNNNTKRITSCIIKIKLKLFFFLEIDIFFYRILFKKKSILYYIYI